MLKIVDVDWVEDYKLELEFSDGFKGVADLADIFATEAFSKVNFSAFSLEGTYLDWGSIDLSANKLRELASNNGQYVKDKALSPDDIEAVIKQAAWDSVVLNRPDILQAAIRSFVEKYGVDRVQALTTLKSRPSIYKSLKGTTEPKFGTLVQLAHGVLEISSESQKNKKLHVA